ncbi:hypothetical protein [Pseudomonas luteola]|nr:hypothetical protein [Pseudomonas zeshuii]MBA1250902.1 hypothetical protein [Pseudomonas zeshuii]
MSQHSPSGIEILLGLLFSGVVMSSKIALFIIRTARNIAAEIQARKAA